MAGTIDGPARPPSGVAVWSPRLRCSYRLVGGKVAELLEDEEIEQRLDELGDWEREGDEIQKVFEFDDFTTAIKFVNDVAKLADRYDHHPDIDIRWNKVKLSLSTHSEGGLTSLDFDVAGEIEQSIR
jgi:4a-hydroxytetrahydrobiopterin dehydratase